MKNLKLKGTLIVLAGVLIIVLGILGFIYRDRVGYVLGEFDDTQPPQLISLEFSTRSIDTDDAAVEVTVTFVVSDDLSGVKPTYAFFMQPVSLSGEGNAQLRGIDFLERISGDKYLGTYQGVITFPRYSANGDWYISPNSGHFWIEDEVGNAANLTEDQVMSVLGVERDMLRVNNTATTEDITPPVLKSISVQTEYKTFNTESADAEVKITAVLEDDFAGIDTPGNNGVQTRMMPVNEDYHGQERMVTFELTNTNGLEKTYEGTTTIPKGSLNGNWRIWNFYTKDILGNDSEILYSTLLSTFSSNNIWANNTATTYDIVPPTIKSFYISQSEFNTSAGEVVLDVEIEIEDSFSGVNTDIIGFSIFPLIGTQWRSITDVSRKSGDDYSAVYQGTVTFPQYSKVGIWEISLGTQDKIGNRLECEGARLLDSCDSTQLFPDNPSAIIFNTATADEVTVDREWTLSSDDISAIFPEDTVITKKEGGTFALYRMVMQSYDVTDYPTVEELIEEVIVEEEILVESCEVEEGCETTELVDEGLVDNPVGFLRAGIPGLNLEFSKPVTISLNVDPKYEGAKLDITSFDETEAIWGNETTCTVTNSKCSFTVSHASYFAATYKPTGSIKINSNAAQSYSKYVTLYPAALSKSGTITHMRISNGQNKWTGWRTYKTKYTSWNMTYSKYGGSSSEGTKTVYIQFKDSKGNISKTYSAQIIYNPRKVVPIVISRYVDDGKSSKEYVTLYNRLRGTVKLNSWYFINIKGKKRTLPSNLDIKAGKTVTIYSKKGTNTSTKVYLGLGSTSENWRDRPYDRFRLYTNKGKRIYTRYLY